jgi:hypothetical protein
MNREFVAQIEGVLSIILLIIGLGLVVIALGAEVLGLDLTPGFGMVQMLELLIGLTCLTFAGYLRAHRSRPAGAPRSLQADIGIRLSATGLVFAYTAGWADLIGIGTHIEPAFNRPFVGPLQLGGFLAGVIMIVVGLLMYITSRGSRETSSLEALFTNGTRDETTSLS